MQISRKFYYAVVAIWLAMASALYYVRTTGDDAKLTHLPPINATTAPTLAPVPSRVVLVPLAPVALEAAKTVADKPKPATKKRAAKTKSKKKPVAVAKPVRSLTAPANFVVPFWG